MAAENDRTAQAAGIAQDAELAQAGPAKLAGQAKKLSYEDAIAELEATVQKLELDDVSLDESIRLFSRGVELTAACSSILDEIEGRIVKLVESGPDGAGGAGGAGALREEPYT
ncbi:MAG: exodeoxyribonuclease VII small subunit [Clostridiales bacterium]|jgi:exodeoxyribonuclease VII small subunit|nr:exodeoxyribonuclease VII small subunit [Clostridiales bacterium]